MGFCMSKYDDGEDYGDGFEEIEDRHAFIKKVFIIFLIHLLMTTIICIPFVLVKDVKHFSLSLICIDIAFVRLMGIGCFQSVRRRFPINITFLSIFTPAESYIVGQFVAIRYPILVFMTFGIELLICLSLIIFDLQVELDFTGIIPFLIIGIIYILVTSIIAIFLQIKLLRITICTNAILLYSLYLIVDVQLMLGGRHS